MHDDRWLHPTRLYEYWFVIIPALLALAFFAGVWIDRRAARHAITSS